MIHLLIFKINYQQNCSLKVPLFDFSRIPANIIDSLMHIQIKICSLKTLGTWLVSKKIKTIWSIIN